MSRQPNGYVAFAIGISEMAYLVYAKNRDHATALAMRRSLDYKSNGGVAQLKIRKRVPKLDAFILPFDPSDLGKGVIVGCWYEGRWRPDINWSATLDGLQFAPPEFLGYGPNTSVSIPVSDTPSQDGIAPIPPSPAPSPTLQGFRRWLDTILEKPHCQPTTMDFSDICSGRSLGVLNHTDAHRTEQPKVDLPKNDVRADVELRESWLCRIARWWRSLMGSRR